MVTEKPLGFIWIYEYMMLYDLYNLAILYEYMIDVICLKKLYSIDIVCGYSNPIQVVFLF
jgi:hypothetical protein